MQIRHGQDGLLEEALELIGETTNSLAILDGPTYEELVTALWNHWVACPQFALRWIDASLWPDEVRKTRYRRQPTAKSKGRLDDQHERTWGPRVALLASFGGLGDYTLPLTLDAPPLSKPRRWDRLASDLTAARKLIEQRALLAALQQSFRPEDIDPFWNGSAAGDGSFASYARNQLAYVGSTSPPRDRVVRIDPNAMPYTVSDEIAKLATRVVDENLPFAQADASLPRRWRTALDNIMGLESRALAAFSITPPPGMDVSVLPWTLALLAVGRAFMVEMLANLALAAIPTGLLYWAPRALSHTSIANKAAVTMRSGRKSSAEVKQLYNAYTAIGLWEIWNGSAAPHVDGSEVTAGGDGYVRRNGVNVPRFRDVAAGMLNTFETFWGSSKPHTQVVNAIRTLRRREMEIPRVNETSGRDRETLSEQQAVRQGLQIVASLPSASPGWNVIPAIQLRTRRSDDEPSLGATWQQGAQLHVQVAVYAATQLVHTLGKRAKIEPTTLRWNKKKLEWFAEKPLDPPRHALPLGDGAPRWGGNHAPHLEHRDGLGFDIGHPYDFLPWLSSGGGVNESNEKVRGQTLGVANSDSLLREKAIARKHTADVVQRIYGAQIKSAIERWAVTVPSEKDRDELAAKVWGSPVHGTAREPDSAPLPHNLVGHIALVLAGMSKLVYAGLVQHIYAVWIVRRALDGLVAAAPVTKAATRTEVYCYPTNHYDHWHVVFPDRDTWLEPQKTERGTSKRLIESYIAVWKALGVDFDPIISVLEQRRTSSHPALHRDRTILLEVLGAPAPARRDTEPDEDTLLDRLATAIADQTYPDPPPPIKIPPVKVTIKDWKIDDTDYGDTDDQ